MTTNPKMNPSVNPDPNPDATENADLTSNRKPNRNPNTHTAPVLVLGATGKTGRRVATRLAERGVPVRSGSRAVRPAFDWENPATWPAALAGVERVYVTFQPDLAVPGATDAIAAFTRAARDAGVRRT